MNLTPSPPHPPRVTETSSQQPSGFVQSLVAELVIGSQPSALTAFVRARAAHTTNHFTGWRMDGWVRWLEGLRGVYERRMIQLCRILDAGRHSFSLSSLDSNPDWALVASAPLYTFSFPRGGMFIWLRLHLESHPLFNHPFSSSCSSSPDQHLPIIDGPTLSAALTIFLTTKPYLVLIAGGGMFSATDEIRQATGWAYIRLCFAAESDENIEASGKGFVEGLKAFWEIRDGKVIRRLVDMMPRAESEGMEQREEGSRLRLAEWVGC